MILTLQHKQVLVFHWEEFNNFHHFLCFFHTILHHWGLIHMHICISKQNIIGSDNGLLLHMWRQANVWTNAGLLSNEPLGTNFSEIWIKIQNFSFMKMHLKISSAKLCSFCPGGDELSHSLWANAKIDLPLALKCLMYHLTVGFLYGGSDNDVIDNDENLLVLNFLLTHYGLVMSYYINISLCQCQQQEAITWTNVDLSSVRSSDIHLRKNFTRYSSAINH